MKVLIPGGIGFLGGILTQKLLEKDIEVHVLSRSTNEITHSGETYLRINIDLTNPESFKRIEHSYDAVVYLAGISARDALVSPDQTIGINTLAPQKLLTYLAPNALGTFVYVSTQHVDALIDGTLHENHAGPGLQLYAASKMAGEILLNQANASHKTALAHIRLPNCFGIPNTKYGSDTEVAINDFCRQAAKTSVIHLRAPDNQIRKFCIAELMLDKIAHIVAAESFEDKSQSLLDTQYSSGLIDIAKIVCAISNKVTDRECVVRVIDENLKIDEHTTADLIGKIPNRFIVEIQHLVEYYLEK